MAEQVQRFRQYEYRANSNLVLTTDLHRPRTDEPSGEPESLKDHLSGKKFGDRYAGGKPQTESSSKRSADHKKKDSAKRAKKESENVLSLADDMDTYRPRTKETRTAYETLLTMMQVNLGAQPHDILRGAADEVLACLKNDSLTDPEPSVRSKS
jgi:pre-mRNA-splicing helicase BRR2